MFWLPLFIAYGLITVVLIVIRASLGVIGRTRTRKPKPD